MGTLGKFLRDTRESRGIDLRDAAQQTRISIQYLKALEAEDFSKLPGAVFVRGFLKNYGKFLRLDESEVMRRYTEMQQTPSPSIAAVQAPQPAPPSAQKVAEEEVEPNHSEKIPIEPFVWGAGIIIVLVIALFSALPQRHTQETGQFAAPPSPAGVPGFAPAPASEQQKPEKLYLEVRALEDTWLLVRIDSSPQKKAVLKKGENLIWSADERFLLSFGSAGAVQLLLNGKELVVTEPKNAVVRDMTITADGIVNRNIQPEYVKPLKRKQQPAVVSEPQTTQRVDVKPAKRKQQPAVVSEPQTTQSVGEPAREQQPKRTPAPAMPVPIFPQDPRRPAADPKPDTPPVVSVPSQPEQPQPQQ